MGFMVKKKYFKILQNVKEFLGRYESICLSITATIVTFDFQWVSLEYYDQLPPAEEFWSINLNYKTKSFA